MACRVPCRRYRVMVSSNDEADCQACAEDDAREDFKGIIEMTQPVRPLAFKPIAFETLVLRPLERPLAFKPRVFKLSSDLSKSKGLAALPMLAASPADPEVMTRRSPEFPQRFYDAIFQLADLWTETVEPAEYVAFLSDLLNKLKSKGYLTSPP